MNNEYGFIATYIDALGKLSPEEKVMVGGPFSKEAFILYEHGFNALRAHITHKKLCEAIKENIKARKKVSKSMEKILFDLKTLNQIL